MFNPNFWNYNTTNDSNTQIYGNTGTASSPPSITYDIITPGIGGTQATGDYVKNIIGTAGEIEVDFTSGVGVTSKIGLPNDVTISNDLTVRRNLQVDYNLNINGNVTIGAAAGIFGQVLTSTGTGVTWTSFSGIATYAQTAGIATFAQGLTGTPNLTVGIVTATRFIGDGSQLTGINAGTGIATYAQTAGIATFAGSAGIATYALTSGGGLISISTNTTNQAQYITYATGTGTTTEFGVNKTGLVFNPSTNLLGIGTANPTQALHVQGNARIAGAIYDINNVAGTSGQVLQSVGTGVSWSSLVRLNTSYTTSSLAQNGVEDFTLQLGKLSDLVAIQISEPSWVRIYRSSAQRSADPRSSPGGNLQAMVDLGDNKPYSENVTTTAGQTIIQNPIPLLQGDANGLVYIRLIKISTGSSAVSVITTTYPQEN
jgi:hypothetical protein